MKRSIVGMMILLVALCPSNGLVLAAAHSTGVIWFTQLDGSKFQGVYAGDEFEKMFRTIDNYTFVAVGYDDGPPYEYAIPSADGDLRRSYVEIGKGAPPPESYLLERTGQKQAEIEAARLDFSVSLEPLLERTRQRTLDECEVGAGWLINVAIILVEFPDRPHVLGEEQHPLFPPGVMNYWGQSLENIETMMNSEGIYQGQQVADEGQAGHIATLHPEHDEFVFRSFKEYWQEASYGLWNPVCTVVNPIPPGETEPTWLRLTDDNGVERTSCYWAYLPQCRYVDANGNWQTNWICAHNRFTSDAVARASELGWLEHDPPFDFVIVFSPGGNVGEGEPGGPVCTYGGTINSGSTPKSMGWPLLDRPAPWDVDINNWHFTHIGTICHEFGHLMGFPQIGTFYPDLRGGGFAGLMAQGNGCGIRGAENPNRLGAFLEWKSGLLDCLEERGGGLEYLDVSQQVTATPPTPFNHTVYAFGGTETQPEFFVECRRIALRTPEDQRFEIDDHTLCRHPLHPLHNYTDGTYENQLVVWDRAGCEHPGYTAVTRTNSHTYMYDIIGGDNSYGTSNFWFLWPGSLAESPNTVDWTPFTFPNTGLSGSALVNIAPNDLGHNVTFQFDLDYTQDEQGGPVQIDREVFAYGKYDFTDDVEVLPGGVLHLQKAYYSRGDFPNFGYSTLNFGPNSALLVQPGGGIRGEPRLGFYSSVLAGAPDWNGVRINSSDPENTFAPKISGAAIGVNVQDGHLVLNKPDIRQCGIGAAWVRSTGYVWGTTTSPPQSFIRSNDRYGMYVIDSDVTINGCDISQNGHGGIRFWRAEHNAITNCDINQNGSAGVNVPFRAGLQVLNGTLFMQCTDAERNQGPGLLLLSQTYADLGDAQYSALNHFYWNNQAYNGEPDDVDYGQIALMGGLAGMACGRNYVADPRNDMWRVRSFFPDQPAPGWDVRMNNWGLTDENEIQPLLPPGTLFVPFMTDAVACDQVYQCNLNYDDEEELFRVAWNEEREAQFGDALASYENLLNEYPNGKYSKLALERIQFCKKALGWSWEEIRGYFQQLAADSSKDPSLVALARSNAAWCLVEIGDYETALTELTALLDQNSPDYVQLKVQLDLLLMELKQDEYELTAHSGKGTPRRNTDSAPETFAAKLLDVDRRVDQLLGQYLPSDTPRSVDIPVPRTYSLAQNYPNPFNPITEIRFELPEKVQVEVAIFNTLGQRVATLVNDTREAGTYRVQWDGSQAASGMYLCQMKAGNFVQTRKMLLLK